MNPTIQIQSRSGNLALAMLGVAYAVSAAILAGWVVVDGWKAMGLVESALTFLLILAAVCGGWFVLLAARGAHIPHNSHHAHVVR